MSVSPEALRRGGEAMLEEAQCVRSSLTRIRHATEAVRPGWDGIGRAAFETSSGNLITLLERATAILESIGFELRCAAEAYERSDGTLPRGGPR